MAKAEAIRAAAALDREAADLAAQSRAKLAEACKVREPHCNWIEQETYAAAAEVACWHPGKRAEFQACYGAATEGERADG